MYMHNMHDYMHIISRNTVTEGFLGKEILLAGERKYNPPAGYRCFHVCKFTLTTKKRAVLHTKEKGYS